MKKNEKFLALLLSVVMILTCFVGTVTVNAENATPTATIVVTADAVEVGATEIPVTLTVESEVGINEALIKVSSDLGDIIAQPTVVVNEGVGTAIADNAGNATDYNAFYLSAVSPDGQAETVMGEITKATIKVVFTNEAGIAAKETPYTVNVEIPEGKVIAASKDEVAIDLVCDGLEIVVEEVAACDHTNAAKEVTTQPTKDAEGVMTYTCECGETWTEAIAKPEKLSANVIAYDLVVQEAVSPRIRINTKGNANGVLNLGYADYFIVIEYEKYGDGYVLTNEELTLTREKRNLTLSNAAIDTYDFNELSLLQLKSEFTVTVYAYDANGVVDAYYDSSSTIQSLALAQIAKFPSDTALIKSFADMVKYGAAAQNFFAKANPGTPIATAELPTVGFEAYLDKSSTSDELPASYNTTNTNNLTAVRGAGDLVIAQSNSIAFRMLVPVSYDAKTLSANITYTNGYGTLVEDPIVSVADVEIQATNASAVVYRHLFSKLAIYDLDKTVNLKVYDANGNALADYDYCAGVYIAANINNANYNEFLTTMVLFSQSIGAKLGV